VFLEVIKRKQALPKGSACFLLMCFGASLGTPLELFNMVAEHTDTIQAWNEAVKVFLAKERNVNTLSVTL
jgi:hypothetical protein